MCMVSWIGCGCANPSLQDLRKTNKLSCTIPYHAFTMFLDVPMNNSIWSSTKNTNVLPLYVSLKLGLPGVGYFSWKTQQQPMKWPWDPAGSTGSTGHLHAALHPEATVGIWAGGFQLPSWGQPPKSMANIFGWKSQSRLKNQNGQISGWWFETCFVYFCHRLGTSIPTDEIIFFQRGGSTTR